MYILVDRERSCHVCLLMFELIVVVVEIFVMLRDQCVYINSGILGWGGRGTEPGPVVGPKPS